MFQRASLPAIQAERTLNMGWWAAFAVVCLCSFGLAACAGIHAAGSEPSAEASGTPFAVATAIPPSAQIAASPSAAQQQGSAARARTARTNAERVAAQKAAQASANAMKASKQAALASKEAAGAVAVLQPGAKPPGVEGMAKPGAPDVPPNVQTPIVTLGDVPPAAPPIGDSPASGDSPAAASAATIASADDNIHLKADRMIHDVNEESKKIDSSNLDSDEKRRQTIALRLLKSAEKSYTDQDYSAAYSLAVKASILLKPLPQGSTSASP
jgi:hypothetical protein